MPEFDLHRLRRFPDVEAAELQAWDATDELLVRWAIETGVLGEQIAVIGDGYGAMTLALAAAGLHGIRVHQDLVTGRRALVRNAAALGLTVGVLRQESAQLFATGRYVDTDAPAPGEDTALTAVFSHELDWTLLAGARLVLLQLPKSLAELEEIADAVARWAERDVTLVAGGRVKHMTLAQNDVLARSFNSVQPQRAERKSRLIVATVPRLVPADRPFPISRTHDGFTLCAFGGAFAGARLDIGTRALLDAMPQLSAGFASQLRRSDGDRSESAVIGDSDEQISGVMAAEHLRQAQRPGEESGLCRGAESDRGSGSGQGSGSGRGSGSGQSSGSGQGSGSGQAWEPSTNDQTAGTLQVVDLGCGTGALAAMFALQHPHAVITATDRSAAAVRSARATMRANGLEGRVTVTLDDAGSELPEQSADVILLNPPFHLGTSVHEGAGHRLIQAAARLLKPGGEAWTVFNSHLDHRRVLSREVGATEQVLRTSKFTVTRSIRRG